jgi:hypothetical protein
LAAASTAASLDSPQTRHNAKKSGSENGGFLRVCADRNLWRETLIFGALWKSTVANLLILLVERVTGIEPA